MSVPRKKLGIWLATALVVGNIIGSAIFVLPSSLAPFGWNAVTAWIVSTVGALFIAWIFATLFRHLPDVGGSYGFMRAGLSEGTAFLGAWGYIISIWAGNAAITIGGVSYLTRLIPALGQRAWVSALVAVVAIWFFTWVNLQGLQAAGRVQLVTSIIKLLPFAAVIGLAIWRLVGSRDAILPPIHKDSFSLAGTTGAVTFTLYALTGLESAALPADAVEDAGRIVPRATMLGTSISALVSVIASCAVALMMPAAAVIASNAPISDFIAISWGNVAGWFVALCAVVSCFGCLNGFLLLSGEFPASIAAAGSLPQWFGARNSSGAPAISVVIGSVVTTVLTLLAYTKAGVGAFNFALLLSTATTLVLYLFCTLAIWRFMKQGRVPWSLGLMGCTVGALGFELWAFYGAGWESLGWGTVLVLAGWPLYLVARRVSNANSPQ